MLSSSFTESGVQVERQTSEFIRNCTIIETVLEVTTRFLVLNQNQHPQQHLVGCKKEDKKNFAVGVDAGCGIDL